MSGVLASLIVAGAYPGAAASYEPGADDRANVLVLQELLHADMVEHRGDGWALTRAGTDRLQHAWQLDGSTPALRPREGVLRVFFKFEPQLVSAHQLFRSHSGDFRSANSPTVFVDLLCRRHT